MALALAQTCKVAIPARAAARTSRATRRCAVVTAKAAAPVNVVRVQQKVR